MRDGASLQNPNPNTEERVLPGRPGAPRAGGLSGSGAVVVVTGGGRRGMLFRLRVLLRRVPLCLACMLCSVRRARSDIVAPCSTPCQTRLKTDSLDVDVHPRRTSGMRARVASKRGIAGR